MPDADSARDAPLDHGDARRMDAAPADTLPCLQSPSLAIACPSSASRAYCAHTWDAIVSDPYYCQNGVATTPLFVTGTCGDYRLLEDDSSGDDVRFFYYDTSGALVAIVEDLGGKYSCTAGLVAAIAAPCLYLNSPSATKLVCPTDAGAPD
jgi:hypothetical protein